VHALLFSGTDLVLGGINAASEGIVDRVAFDGTSAATTRVGTVPRETTHAAAFNDALYVLARNGARGELYVENDSALGFGVVAGGPSDCLFLHDGALYGCGKQVGAATSLFLRSDDGVTWTELVAFSDVHYRACPDDTVGFSECARFLETSCGDGDDSDLDGKTDCADEDCAFNAACAGDGEGDAGEGEGDVGEGEGDDVAGAREGDGGDETDRGGCSCAEVDAASLGAVLVPLAWRRRRRV
jgi:uncharacterized protein (TIGR03382 family)